MLGSTYPTSLVPLLGAAAVLSLGVALLVLLVVAMAVGGRFLVSLAVVEAAWLV